MKRKLGIGCLMMCMSVDCLTACTVNNDISQNDSKIVISENFIESNGKVNSESQDKISKKSVLSDSEKADAYSNSLSVNDIKNMNENDLDMYQVEFKEQSVK